MHSDARARTHTDITHQRFSRLKRLVSTKTSGGGGDADGVLAAGSERTLGEDLTDGVREGIAAARFRSLCVLVGAA